MFHFDLNQRDGAGVGLVEAEGEDFAAGLHPCGEGVFVGREFGSAARTEDQESARRTWFIAKILEEEAGVFQVLFSGIVAEVGYGWCGRGGRWGRGGFP